MGAHDCMFGACIDRQRESVQMSQGSFVAMLLSQSSLESRRCTRSAAGLRGVFMTSAFLEQDLQSNHPTNLQKLSWNGFFSPFPIMLDPD